MPLDREHIQERNDRHEARRRHEEQKRRQRDRERAAGVRRAKAEEFADYIEGSTHHSGDRERDPRKQYVRLTWVSALPSILSKVELID